GGKALEGVDLDVADAVKVRKQLDIRVVACIVFGALIVLHAFRVIVGHRASHDKLDARELTLDTAVDINYAQRILPRIEARYLNESGTIWIHAVERHDATHIGVTHQHVFGAEWIDGRWDDGGFADLEVMLDILLHGEDCCVIHLHKRA